jgi:serine/threonine-protein kinase 40
LCVSQVPKEGTPVETKAVKRAGPYLLGPTLGSSPVKSIVQCLARRDGTDDFYILKVGTWIVFILQDSISKLHVILDPGVM